MNSTADENWLPNVEEDREQEEVAPLARGVESDDEFEENKYSKEALLRLGTAPTPCQCPVAVLRCGEVCSNRRERRECSPSQHGGRCSNMVSANKHRPKSCEFARF